MSSVSEPRVHYPRDAEQHECRVRLMYRFRESLRYQWMIERDLKPSWSAIPREGLPLRGELWSFKGWQRHSEPEVEAYTSELKSKARALRLVHHSEPAEWALECLHWDTKYWKPGIEADYPAPSILLDSTEFQINFQFDPPSAKISVSSYGVEIGTVTEVTFGYYSDRALWQELERIAHNTLQDLMRQSREWVERGHPEKNRAALRQRNSEIKQLYDLLTSNCPLTVTDRERFKRLATLIGIDLPRRR